MKINGVNPNKIINPYSNNKKNVENKSEVSRKDSLEISLVGKSLSSYSIDDNFINSNEKIEKLKNEIEKGTYNRDGKLIAEKMLEEIKKR